MSSVQIADGWDATPVNLETFDPDLFQEYAAVGGVLTSWDDCEEIEANGDREDVEIGRPMAKWIFDIWTRDEMAFWKQEFGNRVSITTLNGSDNEYQTFNAKMRKIRVGEVDYEGGWFKQVEIQFYDLIAQV